LSPFPLENEAKGVQEHYLLLGILLLQGGFSAGAAARGGNGLKLVLTD
jgi:hypothetical protein